MPRGYLFKGYVNMVEKKDTKGLSNAELKIYLTNLENEFEGKKIKLREICEEMDAIEEEYLSAKQEMEIRKNLYV